MFKRERERKRKEWTGIHYIIYLTVSHFKCVRYIVSHLMFIIRDIDLFMHNNFPYTFNFDLNSMHKV